VVLIHNYPKINIKMNPRLVLISLLFVSFNGLAQRASTSASTGIAQPQPIMLLSTALLGQTEGLGFEKIKKDESTAKTYFDLMINVQSTNLHYGNLNTALADYKKSVKGIQAGVSFQAGITPQFSLVSELYFMMKGGKLLADNPLTRLATTYRFYSCELPVLARVHLGNFYINAGPSIAYNFKGTKKVEGLTTDLSFKDSDEGLKRLDVGVQGGVGYMFKIKEKRLALDVKYNYGLTNISSDKDMYNRGLMVSVHYSRAWKTNPLRKQ
jgi:Outer membrane protein beta-barrel domain